MSTRRLNELRKKLQAENLDGMVIAHRDHIRYLTGFTGSTALLIISARAVDFFTDFRYADQARRQVRGAAVSIVRREPFAALKEFPRLNVKNRKYAFSGEYLTVAQKEKLQQALPDSLFIAADSILADLGWVKESKEITNIKKAVEIADLAFERVLNLVKPGVRERDLAAELEYQMALLGSEKPAFETMVASGYRSALPHGVASPKRLKEGEFVTLDFGATVSGYVSDITRTVVLGKPTPKQKRVYDIVMKAQRAAIRKVRAGVMAKDVDAAARRIIQRAGFGKNFGHGTGHGIGFYVHLGPKVSWQSEDKLLPNNVITIEPGIYISGWGGVRIEDDVLVTRTGGIVLNKAPKNLLVL
ncbi:MAG: M24 family metallopeptidase [Candidatus Zixiibacteriota bacterium]